MLALRRGFSLFEGLVPLLEQKHVFGRPHLQGLLSLPDFATARSNPLRLLNRYQLCLVLRERPGQALDQAFLKFEQDLPFPHRDYKEQAASIARISRFEHHLTILFVYLKLYSHKLAFSDIDPAIIPILKPLSVQIDQLRLDPILNKKLIHAAQTLLIKANAKLSCAAIQDFQQKGLGNRNAVNPFDQTDTQKSMRKKKAKQPFMLKVRESCFTHYQPLLCWIELLDSLRWYDPKLKLVCETLFAQGKDLSPQNQLLLLRVANQCCSSSISALRKIQDSLTDVQHPGLLIQYARFLANNRSDYFSHPATISALRNADYPGGAALLARAQGSFSLSPSPPPHGQFFRQIQRILSTSGFEFSWVKAQPLGLSLIKFGLNEATFLLPALDSFHLNPCSLGDQQAGVLRPEVEQWQQQCERREMRVYYIKERKLNGIDGYFKRKRLLTALLGKVARKEVPKTRLYEQSE